MSSSAELDVRLASDLKSFSAMTGILIHSGMEKKTSAMQDVREEMRRLAASLEKDLPEPLKAEMETNLKLLNQAIDEVDLEGIKESLLELHNIMNNQ